MQLQVNGEQAQSRPGITISELLVEQKVKMPEMVTVELNGTIIRPERFGETVLNENDQVEFLYFMGGGASESH